MKQVRTGSVTHSALGLGCADFGTNIGGMQAFEMIDAFLAGGGTLLDTAAVYADWVPGAERSASEKCLGRYLKQAGVTRAVLATKGVHPGPDMISRVRPELILSDCAQSLENLGVDTIDIYFLHRDDVSVPANELMDALFRLQDEGAVRAIGVSNWTLARQKEANDYAALCRRRGLDAVQQRYAYLKKEYEEDKTIVAFDEDMDGPYTVGAEMTVFAFTAQMKGFFDKREDGRLTDVMKKYYDTPANAPRIARAAALSEKLGLSAQDLSLAALLHRPWPVCALAGCKNTEQIAKSIRASEIELSDADAEYLNI